MRILTTLAAAVIAAVAAQGQFIAVTPAGVVGPGTPLTATVWGSPAAPLYRNGTRAFLLTGTGDLVTPRFFQGQTVSLAVTGPPGYTATVSVPASGSSGSHVLYVQNSSITGSISTPGFCGLVARVDVGAQTPGFPALHTFPLHVINGFGGHNPFVWGGTADWCLANVSPTPITLGAGDLLQVFHPGGTSPLLTLSLAGMTIPGSQVIGFPALLQSALPPGPYTVQISLNDPIAGPIVRRTGVHGSPSSADLHLPQGHTVPLGGSIQAYVQIGSTSGPPSFAVVLGFAPGFASLPNGVLVPVVPDALVIASLANGLGGLITNFSGVATPSGPTCFGYCAPGGITTTTAGNIGLAHPGPVASGLTVRMTAVAFRPPLEWLAGQAEEITFQ